MNIIHFTTIDSTNSYAKRLLSECGSLRDKNETLTPAGQKYHKSAIIAESQTAGRGRLGRTFVSPEKTGIYFSMIYSPTGGIQNPAIITTFAAIAVYRVLKREYKINVKIKWINDIFLNGKKIAGILTEGVINQQKNIIESAIIGIGINIEDNNAFSPEMTKKIGSLLGTVSNYDDSKSSLKINKFDLAKQIINELFMILDSVYECPKENFQSLCFDLIQEYKSNLFILGTKITVHPIIDDESTSYIATATDIDENANLIVELEDGTKKALNSGEVSLHS